jgi:hypothetical protein
MSLNFFSLSPHYTSPQTVSDDAIWSNPSSGTSPCLPVISIDACDRTARNKQADSIIKRHMVDTSFLHGLGRSRCAANLIYTFLLYIL